MKLSDECMRKLEVWVDNDWYKVHDRDMTRFYHFVDAYIKDNGYHISDESMLAETIAKKAGIETIDPLFKTIRERVSLMYNILDFLKATKRQ